VGMQGSFAPTRSPPTEAGFADVDIFAKLHLRCMIGGRTAECKNSSRSKEKRSGLG
jgi:hypothetical protein